MTLIEKVYRAREANTQLAWTVMRRDCPFEVFTNGIDVPEVCKTDDLTNVTCVDCSKCWLQEYKEEYGEVIPK